MFPQCGHSNIPSSTCTSQTVQSLSHVWIFATPWSAACHASLSITNSQSLLKFMSIESVMPSNHLILCCPLFLPPSIFPSIRVFSNESVLRIRWPQNWSCSLSPSNDCSGLTSFRMDWLDLPADLHALLEPCYSPSGVVYSFLLKSGRHSVTALTIRMPREWHCSFWDSAQKAVQPPCGWALPWGAYPGTLLPCCAESQPNSQFIEYTQSCANTITT